MRLHVLFTVLAISTFATAQSMAGTVGQFYVSPNAPKPRVKLTARAEFAFSILEERVLVQRTTCPTGLGRPTACGLTTVPPDVLKTWLRDWRTVREDDDMNLYQVGPLLLGLALLRTDTPGTPYFEKTLVMLVDLTNPLPKNLIYEVAPGFPLFKRTIKITNPPMYGQDIKAVQQHLLKLGFKEVGKPDSYYGPNTMAAVKHFQRFTGMPESGLVDAVTWATLFSK